MAKCFFSKSLAPRHRELRELGFHSAVLGASEKLPRLPTLASVEHAPQKCPGAPIFEKQKKQPKKTKKLALSGVGNKKKKLALSHSLSGGAPKESPRFLGGHFPLSQRPLPSRRREPVGVCSCAGPGTGGRSQESHVRWENRPPHNTHKFLPSQEKEKLI